MSQKIEIYDVTLRDGAQGPGVKFSSLDQLRVVQELDDFGVAYIEGGQPGSNPKAAELFARANDMDLKNAKMAAFGSTRYSKSTVEDDLNIKALLGAQTEVITIFAKSSALHAKEVLKVGLDENLTMIQESVEYLKAQNRRVFFDAEHFYDGYREDPEYALSTLESAWQAGAEVLILCDTNGSFMPWQIAQATKAARERLPEAPLGIHAHNDSGCAVANTLTAITEGATQIQGTINGYGERTGNANLMSVIPNIQLKMEIPIVSEKQLASMTRLSHLVAELANMLPKDSEPFVGRDAFTHKGGMHADAVRKLKVSYEHVKPESIGNRTHIPVSEMSGRSSLLEKATEFGIELDRNDPETRAILAKVKELENEGYEFEGAEASLELLIRRAKHESDPFFILHGFHVSITRHEVDGTALSEATVRIELPDGTRMHTAAEGSGPVDALNAALRAALEETYPELKDVHLEDYKVRIIDGKAATRARTRVLIESSDPEQSWNTVGVSENIIEASYDALVDSIEYKLMQTRNQ